MATRKRVHVSWDDNVSHSDEGKDKIPVSIRSRQKRNQYRTYWIPRFCSYICVIPSLLIVFSIIICYIYSTKRLRQPQIQSRTVQDTKNIINIIPTEIHQNSIHSTTSHQSIADYHFQRYFPTLSACKEVENSQIDFTLVTQLSEDRLWMMKHVCSRWGTRHPISIVLFTNRTHEEALRDLRSMGCRSFNKHSNLLDNERSHLQIFDSSLSHPEEYPINRLRNMALSVVQTSHALYIDIDLWPSSTLYESLHHPTVLEALSFDPKLAIVIPSFQLNPQCPPNHSCLEKNVNKMPSTAVEIPNMVISKDVTQLDPSNTHGHGSTNYKEWFRVVNSMRKGEDTKDHALYNITCFISNRYEPYMVIRVCDTLPPFQEQFTGYGKNKITWIMHLRRLGYRFVQLSVGGDFLIHVPHAESLSRIQWNQGPLRKQQRQDHGRISINHKIDPRKMSDVDWLQYKRGRVDSLYVAFKQWLETNIPDQSRVPLCKNILENDEKLWIHRESSS